MYKRQCQKRISHSYKKEYLQYDAVCALTTGIIAIPQGMANAMLANLPPVYGLYGGIIPIFVFSVFTGSYQLHVGPYAISSVLCASFLSFIDYETEMDEFVSAIVTIAFLSGLFLVVLSLLRLGIVTRILSYAVVTAFTAASAIQLLTSQIGGYWDVTTGSGSPDVYKRQIHLCQCIESFEGQHIQNEEILIQWNVSSPPKYLDS